jgi:hypothetical protein
MNKKCNITNTEKLLIGLCRLEYSSEQIGKLKSLVTGLEDWKYLADLSNRHGVAALVYYNLEKLGFLQFIPQETVDFLLNALMMSMARNAHHLKETEMVLKLMNEAGIKTVLLKGLALEISVYGNRGLRQMTDVDVLMKSEDCMRARDILISNGFTSLPLKSPLHKIIMMNIGKHLPSLIKNGFSIEIHHRLFGSGESELDSMLYDKCTENSINNEKVFIPGAQILFLYLIRHLYMHERNNESQIRLYTDLVVFIGKYREDIINSDLPVLAKMGKMSNILANKLEILRDFWEISFPGWLNEFIESNCEPGNKDKFIFFLKSPKDNPAVNKAWFYRYTIGEIPGIHRKLLYISGDLFPSISFMKKRYNCNNSWKVVFYYPHRLGKLWYLIKLRPQIKKGGIKTAL